MMKFNYRMLHRELRISGRLLNLMTRTLKEKHLSLMNKVSRLRIRPTKTMNCLERWIRRPDGTALRLRIYKPLNQKQTGPAILWMHGGGYAIGVPEQSASTCRRLLDEGAGVIVLPDYRLSTEQPYPAALEDCYLALKWLKLHAGELGGRRDQLMVGGESAGGGLTAALTLLARDKKEVNIAFQMPLYPMIDDRMTNQSARDNHAPIWNSKKNYMGWKLYLGELFETDDVPYYAAPARAEDYSELPPAVTFVGDLEPFFDETITYCRNLKKAGIRVQCKVYKGCYHGFNLANPKALVSKRAEDEFIKAFRYASRYFFKGQED